MTEPTSLSLTPFAWVHKRDGRLVPFEADKISRGLFATSESLGHPDAFLARELTDGILHFLAAEARGTTPTTAQIAELVIKVVRELGQPALAEAFAEGQARKAESGKQGEEDHRRSVSWPEDRPGWGAASASWSAVPHSVGPAPEQLAHWVDNLPSPGALTWRAAHACLANYSLREIFSRDIVAAQSDGFLTLTGLHAPLELAGCVLANPRSGDDGVLEAVEEARSLTGTLLTVDGPEYLLARQPGAAVGDFVRALRTALRFTHLRAVLNLNIALPPPWAENLADGPLFAGGQPVARSDAACEWIDDLAEHFLSRGALGDGGRVDWHLGEHDFATSAAARLLGLARRALEGAPLAFVFDRPNRAVTLAEGLDRQHSSLLLWVGLHLPRLLQLGEARKDATLFLRKLGSLARLALSAALQKRDFLRRRSHKQPNLSRGFLLDRARLVVVPVGLDAVVQAFIGRGLCSGGAALELAQQIIRRLRDVLHDDARAHLLETGLDSFPDARLAASSSESPDVGDGLPTTDSVPGLTCWDAEAAPQTQLRIAGALHAAAGAGTASVLLTEEHVLTPETMVEWLHYAWQQTDLVRVRFLRVFHRERQLTAPWETVG